MRGNDMSKEHKEYFELNRKTWNAKTPVHLESDFYNVKDFKAGKITSLNDIELSELGDVNGKSLLHLQCHFGMDTISWAKLGAKVTGVDLSDEGIKQAKTLVKEMNIPADFVCSNVYDAKDVIKDKFDIVFTSYGVIGWLPDVNKWAETVSYFLKPGGTFYIAEFHPVMFLLDEKSTNIKYEYFHCECPTIEEVSGTYANREAQMQTKICWWIHSFSDIINALIKNGLDIEFIHEFDYSPYNIFPTMHETSKGKWQVKGLERKVPMIFSIKATKK
jgi:2-polyprenyl-3-methyl-5-hydroxy-6-metoxy-1,4-benzoquinol methylase